MNNYNCQFSSFLLQKLSNDVSFHKKTKRIQIDVETKISKENFFEGKRLSQESKGKTTIRPPKSFFTQQIHCDQFAVNSGNLPGDREKVLLFDLA